MDDFSREAPRGEAGELMVRGPFVIQDWAWKVGRWSDGPGGGWMDLAGVSDHGAVYKKHSCESTKGSSWTLCMSIVVTELL